MAPKWNGPQPLRELDEDEQAKSLKDQNELARSIDQILASQLKARSLKDSIWAAKDTGDEKKPNEPADANADDSSWDTNTKHSATLEPQQFASTAEEDQNTMLLRQELEFLVSGINELLGKRPEAQTLKSSIWAQKS